MKNILYIILALLLFNCTEKNKLPESWKMYSDKKVKVLIPSNWTPKIKEDLLLLVPIDKKLNLYYAVIEYDVKKVTSTKHYLKEIFKQVSENTDITYSLKKITFRNGETSYLVEFDNIENGISYKTFNTIYPKDDKIYDFGFKTINDQKLYSSNRKIFNEVMLSLEKNNQKIVDGENLIIENLKEIKYEDLE